MWGTNPIVRLVLIGTLAALVSGPLAGCGTVTTATSSGSSDGSSDSGSGDDGSDATTGGTDTTNGGSGFLISGTLSGASASVGVGKVASAASVTDVMAVSPETGDTACTTAEVADDGSFDLSLDPNKPWLLYFLDRAESGAEMYVAHLVSESLDTLTPLDEDGSMDVGTVTVAADEATGSIGSSDFLSGLGLDDALAALLGEVDDIAERYSNPDVDGNGEIDCSESGKRFILDFHVRFNMTRNGSMLSIADLIDQELGDDVTATYTSTGVYVAYPSSFSSATSGSVRFVDSAVTTDEGGAIAANTETSAVTSLSFFDMYSYGPNISTSSELPSGEIVFTFGSETLTFINVVTPSLADLNAPVGRIFPFIEFVKDNASCTSDCTLGSINYRWMQRTATGWSAADLSAVTALVTSTGVSIGIRVDNDSSRLVMFNLPKTAVSGTVAWEAANASLEGVSAAEFDAITTDQLCHLGLSYDDQLGMRYFQNINDAPGTCE